MYAHKEWLIDCLLFNVQWQILYACSEREQVQMYLKIKHRFITATENVLRVGTNK